MRVRSKKASVPPTKPRAGDTLVTLSTNTEVPLEDKMDLLGYSFAKIIQGAVLRRIVKWDLKNGRIQFVVGDGPARPGPRGTVIAELDHYGVDFEEHKLSANEVA